MEKFICPICSKELKNLQVLNAHITSHKQKQEYQNGVDCPLCKKHFSTMRGLYRHSTENHTQQEQIQIYEIINNNYSKHICENCSNEAMFNSVSKGFFRYCSIECRDILNKINHKHAMENVDYTKVDFVSRNEKSKKTWTEIYGVDNPQKNKSIRQKSEKTLEEKTGFKTTFSNPNLRREYEDSRELRTGYRNPWSSPTVNKKCIDTKTSNLKEGENFFTKSFNTLEGKTGYRYPQQNPKTRKITIESCIKSMGVANPMQVKENIYKALESKRLKYKNGNCDESIFTEEFIKAKQQKQYATKRKNNTFHTSKKETDLYNKLRIIYPSIEFQKTDYLNFPFNVDYYIPEYDLLIEYQGTWTHGREPFDYNNINHIKLLNKWKEKSINSKYYQNAVLTWTVRDVNKLRIATQMNLNYLRLYDSDIDRCISVVENYIKGKHDNSNRKA